MNIWSSAHTKNKGSGRLRVFTCKTQSPKEKGDDGTRTRDQGFADPCLIQLGHVAINNSADRKRFSGPMSSAISHFLQQERAKGFEPSTFSLARRRSTTELHPQYLFVTKQPMPRARIELATPRFSVACSTN